MLDGAVHARFVAAAVEPGQRTGHLVGKERIVPCGDERFGNTPDIFFGAHPVPAVEARQVDGLRISAEGALAAQIVVVLDVTEGQFAQAAVDRRAESQSGEVGLCDAAPETVLTIESDDMVVIMDGFKIHQERRLTVNAQCGRGQEGSFEAVPAAFAQGPLGRASGVGVVIGQVVDELLDFRRRLQGTESTQIRRRQAESFATCACGVPRSLGPQWLSLNMMCKLR